MPDLGGCSVYIKEIKDDGIVVVTDFHGEKVQNFQYKGSKLEISDKLLATTVSINGMWLTANGYSRDKSRKLFNYLYYLKGKAEAEPAKMAQPEREFSNSKTAVLLPEAQENHRGSLDEEFGRFHALVIGNGVYETLPDLKSAINDAKAVAATLDGLYGFQVDLITNATRADVIRKLAELRRVLTEDDNLVIYYAGHGWLDKAAERGYWLPVDAREDDPTNWIDNASVTGSVRAMKAKHILVVADSCYSGSLTRGIKVVVRSADYVQRMSAKKARTVLTSGGLEPVADSGGGNHSAFAKAFLDALRGNTGVMDGHQLFTLIRHPVMVNSDQTPEYGDIHKAGHDGGDFLFVRTR